MWTDGFLLLPRWKTDHQTLSKPGFFSHMSDCTFFLAFAGRLYETTIDTSMNFLLLFVAMIKLQLLAKNQRHGQWSCSIKVITFDNNLYHLLSNTKLIAFSSMCRHTDTLLYTMTQTLAMTLIMILKSLSKLGSTETHLAGRRNAGTLPSSPRPSAARSTSSVLVLLPIAFLLAAHGLQPAAATETNHQLPKFPAARRALQEAGEPCSDGGAALHAKSGLLDFFEGHADNDICRWTITCPANKGTPILTFTQFDTEEGFDWVDVFGEANDTGGRSARSCRGPRARCRATCPAAKAASRAAAG